MAQQYPDKRVTGVDISRLMIEYARFQATQHHISNARFRVMNILEGLDFSDASFDLVNARLLASFLFRTIDAWPKAIQEYIRVTRPGGTIRLTECEWPLSTSATMEKYSGLALRAIQLAGNTFSPDGRNTGTTPILGRFLRNAGCKQLQTRSAEHA